MSPSQPPPFPIGPILLKTYRSLFDNFGYALRITWAWILVVVSARIGADLIQGSLLTSETGEPLLSWNLTFQVGWLTFLPLASIAVAWHRLLLTGERDTSIIYLRLDRLVWGYIGYAFVIYLIAILPILVPWGLALVVKFVIEIFGGSTEGQSAAEVLFAPLGPGALPIIQTASVILFLALTARFAVMLPGKALRVPGMSLRGIWRTTRSYTIDLVIGVLFCVVPFLLLTASIRRTGFNYSAADGSFLHIADWLMVETASAFLILLLVAFISYCFQFFFPNESSETTST